MKRLVENAEKLYKMRNDIINTIKKSTKITLKKIMSKKIGREGLKTFLRGILNGKIN